jgi:hypothetical protein
MDNTFKVKSNKTKKTYTVTIDEVTYRTLPLTKEEFEECYYYTYNDWCSYIRNNQLIVVSLY